MKHHRHEHIRSIPLAVIALLDNKWVRLFDLFIPKIRAFEIS